MTVELVSDKACTQSVIIDHGTQRFFNYLPTQNYDSPDCCQNVSYPQKSTIFLGLTCDYAYLQLTKQAYYWNHYHALPFNRNGTGFPILAVGLRGAAWRSKVSRVDESGTYFNAWPHVMRIGPNFAYSLTPVVQLFEYYNWNNALLVTLDYTMIWTSEYGYPMDGGTPSDVRDRSSYVDIALSNIGVNVLYIFLGRDSSRGWYVKVGGNGRMYCNDLTECNALLLMSIADYGRLAIWMMDWSYFVGIANISHQVQVLFQIIL